MILNKKYLKNLTNKHDNDYVFLSHNNNNKNNKNHILSSVVVIGFMFIHGT